MPSHLKSMISRGSQKYSVLKKEAIWLNNIPLYEGDKDPRIHWFVCEKLWDAIDIIEKDKQMAQFRASL